MIEIVFQITDEGEEDGQKYRMKVGLCWTIDRIKRNAKFRTDGRRIIQFVNGREAIPRELEDNETIAGLGIMTRDVLHVTTLEVDELVQDLRCNRYLNKNRLKL